MKFCKNLQKVVDISDPEWAPYWTNYKMLKRLIKELPLVVPADEPLAKHIYKPEDETLSPNQTCETLSGVEQKRGDLTAEANDSKGEGRDHFSDAERAVEAMDQKAELGRNPGEIAFFKLLHAEFKKATHFFQKAQEEFEIREERVREGMELMKNPNAIMVNEKWALLAKSIYRLYKDLLLLETFAIMTYCSFSKILKKHDKVTGRVTRSAFMSNVVNKSNFASYPKVLRMIAQCESMYEDVTQRLVEEGKEDLCEDERLFINMINRLNEQTLGHEDAAGVKAKRPKTSVPLPVVRDQEKESADISSLRLLVEANNIRCPPAVVEDRKRCASESASEGTKRARSSE